MSLLKKTAAAQKTHDSFINKEFQWGTIDCIHMVDCHLTALGYESILTGTKKYTSYIGARRALKAAGYTDVAEYFDAHFQSIPPLMAVTGDVIAIQGAKEKDTDPDWHALGVHIGQNKVLAFAGTDVARCLIGPNDKVTTKAWRVVVAKDGE